MNFVVASIFCLITEATSVAYPDPSGPADLVGVGKPATRRRLAHTSEAGG
jgi:hypothetical protein